MNTNAKSGADGGTVLRFGDCELHVLTHEFWRAGRKLTVRPLVFNLMVLLIEQRPKAVDHAAIARAVWGRADVRPSLVAQAVMQARELTGDTGEQPATFVSVRGVGYRFAAAVTEGASAGDGDAPPSGLEVFHATMADAEAALAVGDNKRAQYLADRALALADAAGVNRERSRALSLASQVALTRGTLEQAASLAARALRLADAEGLAQVAAQARMRVARVRLVVGDLYGGLAQLELACRALDTHNDQEERRQCERLLSLACREVGLFDQALLWCSRAQVTAQSIDKAPSAMAERTFEVDLHLVQAEALLARGEAAMSRSGFEHALQLNDALRCDAENARDPAYHLCWLGNRALALVGLERCDEAWPVLEAHAAALQAWSGSTSPVHLRWRAGHHRLKADLYHRSGRTFEALDEVKQALQLMTAAGLRTELPRLMSLAGRVCESAGQFELALHWMRQERAEVAAMQLERAATLAAVMQAESQADTLRRDLEAARQQAQQLALENRALLQRVNSLEQARLIDDLGFTDPLFLRSTLEPRHAEARQRDLPFCLVLLVMDNHEALVRERGAANMREVKRGLAKALAQLLDPTQEVVRWRPGWFLYALENMGERCAREVSQRVQARLNAMSWSPVVEGVPGLAPTFRVACVDAAADAAFEHALDRLQAQRVQEPLLAQASSV